jgi:A/G-specific adenine glycosylase
MNVMTRTNSSLSQGALIELSDIQGALLAWFAEHARDLPWRRTRDPYRIMVSEIMLQQTQVDRVRPKYYAFLEAFPNLESLASAPTAEVIRAWAGLGYNRRAVNMQRTAQAVIREHGGQFPRDLAALLKLPGIGPYTAGAIACFAFEQDVAFIDTNIRRVVQRLFVGPEEAGMAGEAELLGIAQAALPAGQGWAWNQAVMELGALICTAAAPACWCCPVQAHCRALAARRRADEQIFDMAGALEARPQRRVAERREAPYAGSNRFYRGRIVDVLRQVSPGEALELRALGGRVKDDFGDEDAPWLLKLVEGLARDGLVVLEGDRARLP